MEGKPRWPGRIHEGLRSVSASALTLSLLMDDGHAVQLGGAEVQRMLAEVANAAPELLHSALEQRLVSLIAIQVRDTMIEGS
jgi:hypothetical protein